jgi:hypothetical protein
MKTKQKIEAGSKNPPLSKLKRTRPAENRNRKKKNLEGTNRQKKRKEKLTGAPNLPRARNPYTPLARVRVPIREIEKGR